MYNNRAILHKYQCSCKQGFATKKNIDSHIYRRAADKRSTKKHEIVVSKFIPVNALSVSEDEG
jgi:hypothetical protein